MIVVELLFWFFLIVSLVLLIGEPHLSLLKLMCRSHSESTTLPFASLTVKHTLLSALDSLNFSKRALVVGGSGSVGNLVVDSDVFV